MSPSPFDRLTLDKAALASASEEYRRNLAAQADRLPTDWPLTTMAPGYGTTPAPGLTEEGVRRIVREELDRPPSLLAVTAEDVRRFCPDLRRVAR